jgi:putative DNA primase/helicase
VALNAGNLGPVTAAIHAKYPAIKITIAADNDTKTQGNPGLTKALEAVALVGGNYIFPNFEDMGFTGTDFNDYANGGGVL